VKAKNEAAKRFTSAVHRSLRAAASYDGEDEEEAWGLTLNVLATLYGAEEIEEKLDQGYFAHRDASPHGQVLGGLMWCRGDVQHAGGDVRRLDWSRAEAYVHHDGEWVRAQPYVRQAGEWVATQPMARGWTWPPRDDAPPDGRGRHTMYAERVAHRPWLEPMREAASYLMDERHD
jgi:hypothetical protein